jgi:hypothetical protein
MPGDDYLSDADDPHFSSGDAEPLHSTDDDSISASDFLKSFGEEIRRTLDLSTWRIGNDLAQEYARVDREVRDAVERETTLQAKVRELIFPRIKTREKAPKNAGKHEADRSVIEKIHRELLFRGGMEACDGAIQVHDTLPLTIYQLGVTLVSYSGDQGTWSQRLFRRDLKQSGDTRIEDVLASLEHRSRRRDPSLRDGLGELIQKTFLQYAERAILLQHSKAPWLMGRGNPITYELLTGGGNLELMVEVTHVLRQFVEQRQKFVFVAHEPGDEVLLTIGHALRPMEFAIVHTLDERLERWLHQKRFRTRVDEKLSWDNDTIPPTEWIPRVINRVASKIVVGVFRAAPVAPAQVFYAHEDHAIYAAHMVLADSMLQEHRGFPMLAEMARQVCNTVFGDSLSSLADNAYAAAGAPWRFSQFRR